MRLILKKLSVKFMAMLNAKCFLVTLLKLILVSLGLSIATGLILFDVVWHIPILANYVSLDHFGNLLNIAMLLIVFSVYGFCSMLINKRTK